MLQIEASLPAFTVGAGVTVSIIASEEATHGGADCAVRIKVTVPVSPAPGEYVACKDWALSKVPEPVVAQLKLVKLVAEDVVNTYLVPAQIVASTPASAVEACRMFSTIKSFTLAHDPVPVAVKVNCTWPVVMSAALAVYTAARLLASLNVPVPLVVHSREA